MIGIIMSIGIATTIGIETMMTVVIGGTAANGLGPFISSSGIARLSASFMWTRTVDTITGAARAAFT